jgi:hypothetical protein
MEFQSSGGSGGGTRRCIGRNEGGQKGFSRLVLVQRSSCAGLTSLPRRLRSREIDPRREHPTATSWGDLAAPDVTGCRGAKSASAKRTGRRAPDESTREIGSGWDYVAPIIRPRSVGGKRPQGRGEVRSGLRVRHRHRNLREAVSSMEFMLRSVEWKGAGFPVNTSPTWLNQSLQPEAIRAAAEVTKPPKPPRQEVARRPGQQAGRNASKR